MALMCRNRASRSGCWLPSSTFAIPCRLYPSARSTRASASLPHRNPRRAICRAISRSDSVVQVTAATGSPRVDSSSRPRSACLNPGCVSSAFFRPAPGRRDRPGSGSVPSASSPAPAITVARDTPAAPAITATAAASPHPWPAAYARASDPRYSRHARSPRCGRNSANFPASTPAQAKSAPIAQPWPPDPAMSAK